ncbi:MAG: hypothetical protein UY28_C0037G0009 [Candidatus Amesbacteria bacterium GW2011_GWB1_48_13]|uniref:Uncharacterized protein n=1 Tax=Candidatus Amesbacteria bacterium GW2011_GWB1_48_13 TaxID=1618362 RepID=A0A0G1UPZ4_9BACT|nr:MAG: hypothetical protein UY28_C0037G0009 [Candidatus Amesbacteria bacterium GW2011_GWB1_48_13]
MTMLIKNRIQAVGKVIGGKEVEKRYTSDNEPQITMGELDRSLGNIWLALIRGGKADLTATVTVPGQGHKPGEKFLTRP